MTNWKSLREAVLMAAVAAAFTLVPGAVHADASSAQRAQEIAAKFKSADKDHDGKLTLAEAKAGMPRVAWAFDKIDKGKKGYVTLAQLQAFAASR